MPGSTSCAPKQPVSGMAIARTRIGGASIPGLVAVEDAVAAAMIERLVVEREQRLGIVDAEGGGGGLLDLVPP